MWDSSCVSSCLNSFPSPCPSPPPNSSFFRHFASNANPLCSKRAVSSAWNKRQLCPKLGRVSVSPGCLSQQGKGVSACSLALCPGSLEKPALFLDITHSRVWPVLSLLCQMLMPASSAAKSPPSSLCQAVCSPIPVP